MIDYLGRTPREEKENPAQYIISREEGLTDRYS